jgi:hypothetical protein
MYDSYMIPKHMNSLDGAHEANNEFHMNEEITQRHRAYVHWTSQRKIK